MRKRSWAVTLVLAGATGGCGLEERQVAARDVYDSPTDCKADWGDDDTACEAFLDETDSAAAGSTRSSSGAYYRTRYYGPSYPMGRRPTTISTRSGTNTTVGNRAQSNRPVHTSRPSASSSGSRSGSVSRGGFGSSARGSGASS